MVTWFGTVCLKKYVVWLGKTPVRSITKDGRRSEMKALQAKLSTFDFCLALSIERWVQQQQQQQILS
jgi:hypothetical protein